QHDPGKETAMTTKTIYLGTYRAGARAYRASVTRGQLVFDGDPCLGATIQSGAEILISGTCAPADRQRILFRELCRAWVYESGEPRDADGWLDLAATVALTVAAKTASQTRRTRRQSKSIAAAAA